jgi:capsular polysaccharide biosynthesis protein
MVLQRLAELLWASRRALIAIAVAGVVCVAGAAVIVLHPKQYVSSATLVIVGAPTVAEREFTTRTTIDPKLRSWLARYNNPTVVADIYAREYQSRAKLDQLRANGVTGRLTVATKSSVASDAPDHGPVVVLSVFAPNPAQSQTQLQTVVSAFETQLADDQRGSDPALSVTVAIASQSAEAVLVSGSRMRSAFGFVCIGLVAGVLLYALLRRGFRRPQLASSNS